MVALQFLLKILKWEKILKVMQFLKDAKKYINFTIPNLVKKAFPNHALDINLSNQRSVYKFLKKMIMDYLKYPNHSIYHNIIFLKETISIRKIVISKNSQKMINSLRNFSFIKPNTLNLQIKTVFSLDPLSFSKIQIIIITR